MKDCFLHTTNNIKKTSIEKPQRYFSVEAIFYAYTASLQVDTEEYASNNACKADTEMADEAEENKLAVIELISYLVGSEIEVNQDIIALCKEHIEKQYPDIKEILETYENELDAAGSDEYLEQTIIGIFFEKYNAKYVPLSPLGTEEKASIFSYQAIKAAPKTILPN